MRRSLPYRCLRAGLAGVVFFTQVWGAHATESHFWADRRRAAARARVGTEAPDAPELSSSLLTPDQKRLFAQLPQAGPTALIGAPVADAAGGLSLSQKDLSSPWAGEGANASADGSAPAWLSTLILPFGSLREVHLSPAPDAPLIIHVQDAHGVEEAQKNIAGLIQSLQENRGVTLVGVEGAWGAFPLVDPLRAIARPEVVQDVAGAFLKNGVLGGAEYAALTSPRAPVLWGLEEKADYDANVKAVKDGLAVKAKAEALLSGLSARADGLKKKIYSAALLDFDRRAAGYRSREESLGDYARYLVSKAGGKEATNLSLLVRALDAEDALDFHKVEQERLRLVERLARALPGAKLDALVQASLQYRLGQWTYGQYHRYLKSLCREQGVSLADLPQFTAYVDYVGLADRIDRNALLGELDARERAVEASLAAAPDQRRLADASRRLGLLSSLVHHRMSPADWEEYRKDRAAILALPGTLAALSSEASNDAGLAALLPPFEDFCRLALARNTHFVGGLLGKMKADRAKAAVLVAGGFHSEDLVRRLRAQGCSVLVVTPKITEVPKDSNYLDVFARDPLPLEKMFRGEIISLVKPLSLREPGTEANALEVFEGVEEVRRRMAEGASAAAVAPAVNAALKDAEVREVRGNGTHGALTFVPTNGASAVVIAASADGLREAARQEGVKLNGGAVVTDLPSGTQIASAQSVSMALLVRRDIERIKTKMRGIFSGFSPVPLERAVQPVGLLGSYFGGKLAAAIPLADVVDGQPMAGFFEKNAHVFAVGPYKVVLAPWRKTRPMPVAPFSRVMQERKPGDFAYVDAPMSEELFAGELEGVKARVLVNKFPLALDNFLIVPEPEKKRPQHLTAPDLALMARLLAKDNTGRMRLGFNSLTAGASVNNIHIQGFYLPTEDPAALETFAARPVGEVEGADVQALEGPVGGLSFAHDDPAALARAAASYVAFLQEKDVAHSVVAAKGRIWVLPAVKNFVTSFQNMWSYYERAGFIVGAELPEMDGLEERIRRTLADTSLRPEENERLTEEWMARAALTAPASVALTALQTRSDAQRSPGFLWLMFKFGVTREGTPEKFDRAVELVYAPFFSREVKTISSLAALLLTGLLTFLTPWRSFSAFRAAWSRWITNHGLRSPENHRLTVIGSTIVVGFAAAGLIVGPLVGWHLALRVLNGGDFSWFRAAGVAVAPFLIPYLANALPHFAWNKLFPTATLTAGKNVLSAETAAVLEAYLAKLPSRDRGFIEEGMAPIMELASGREWIATEAVDVLEALTARGKYGFNLPGALLAALEAAGGNDALLRQALASSRELAKDGKDPWRILAYGVPAVVQSGAEGEQAAVLLQDFQALEAAVYDKPLERRFLENALPALAEASEGRPEALTWAMSLARDMAKSEVSLGSLFRDVPELIQAAEGRPWVLEKSGEIIRAFKDVHSIGDLPKPLASLAEAAGDDAWAFDEARAIVDFKGEQGESPRFIIEEALVPAVRAAKGNQWAVSVFLELIQGLERGMDRSFEQKALFFLPTQALVNTGDEKSYRAFAAWTLSQAAAAKAQPEKFALSRPSAELMMDLLADAERGPSGTVELVDGLAWGDFHRWSNSEEFKDIPHILWQLSRDDAAGAVPFVVNIIKKRDVSMASAMTETFAASRGIEWKPINDFLAGPARYETKREVALLMMDWGVARIYPSIQADQGRLVELFSAHNRGEVTNGKFIKALTDIVSRARIQMFARSVGLPLSEAMAKDSRLTAKLSVLALLRETVMTDRYYSDSAQQGRSLRDGIKEGMARFVQANADKSGNWDLSPVRRWVLDEIDENKLEKERLIKAGYAPELFEEGIVVKGVARADLTDRALRDRIQQEAAQIPGIALRLGAISESEGRILRLTSAAEAENFIRVSVLARRDELLKKLEGETEEEAATFFARETALLERILSNVQALEAAGREEAAQAGTARAEPVTIVLRKDFIEEASAGDGVPGCFNPRTGGHNEMPPIHATEANSLFAMAYDASGRMIANAVVALTDEGAVVFDQYNTGLLDLHPLWAETWKALARKSPGVILAKPTVAGAPAVPEAWGRRHEGGVAVKRPTLWKQVYYDFGSVHGDGAVHFNLSGALVMTKDTVGEAAPPVPAAAPSPDAAAQARSSFLDAVGKAMAADATLKRYLYILGPLKKSGLAGGNITREQVAEWASSRPSGATAPIDAIFAAIAGAAVEAPQEPPADLKLSSTPALAGIFKTTTDEHLRWFAFARGLERLTEAHGYLSDAPAAEVEALLAGMDFSRWSEDDLHYALGFITDQVQNRGGAQGEKEFDDPFTANLAMLAALGTSGIPWAKTIGSGMSVPALLRELGYLSHVVGASQGNMRLADHVDLEMVDLLPLSGPEKAALRSRLIQVVETLALPKLHFHHWMPERAGNPPPEAKLLDVFKPLFPPDFLSDPGKYVRSDDTPWRKAVTGTLTGSGSADAAMEEDDKLRTLTLADGRLVHVKRVNPLRVRYPEEEIDVAARVEKALQAKDARYHAQNFIGSVYDQGLFYLLSLDVPHSHKLIHGAELREAEEIQQVLEEQGVTDARGQMREEDILVSVASNGSKTFTVLDFESFPHRTADLKATASGTYEYGRRFWAKTLGRLGIPFTDGQADWMTERFIAPFHEFNLTQKTSATFAAAHDNRSPAEFAAREDFQRRFREAQARGQSLGPWAAAAAGLVSAAAADGVWNLLLPDVPGLRVLSSAVLGALLAYRIARSFTGFLGYAFNVASHASLNFSSPLKAAAGSGSSDGSWDEGGFIRKPRRDRRFRRNRERPSVELPEKAPLAAPKAPILNPRFAWRAANLQTALSELEKGDLLAIHSILQSMSPSYNRAFSGFDSLDQLKGRWTKAVQEGAAFRLRAMSEPSVGETVSNYRVDKKLSQGGFGHLYIAHDSEGNAVVLKTPQFRGKFQVELSPFTRDDLDVVAFRKALGQARDIDLLIMGRAGKMGQPGSVPLDVLLRELNFLVDMPDLIKQVNISALDLSPKLIELWVAAEESLLLGMPILQSDLEKLNKGILMAFYPQEIKDNPYLFTLIEELARSILESRRLERINEAYDRLKNPSFGRPVPKSFPSLPGVVVMEKVDGVPLSVKMHSFIRRQDQDLGGILSLDEAIASASALEFSHRQRLVHNDYKPDNAMVVPASQGKPRGVVVDWGIAVSLDSKRRRAGQLDLGDHAFSKHYVAPERVVEREADESPAADMPELVQPAKPHGMEADVYSFSVTLIDLMPPEFVRFVPQLAELISRGMSEDPAERPTMKQFREALEKIRDGLPLEALNFEKKTIIERAGALVDRAASMDELEQQVRSLAPYLGGRSGLVLDKIEAVNRRKTVTAEAASKDIREMFPTQSDVDGLGYLISRRLATLNGLRKPVSASPEQVNAQTEVPDFSGTSDHSKALIFHRFYVAGNKWNALYWLGHPVTGPPVEWAVRAAPVLLSLAGAGPWSVGAGALLSAALFGILHTHDGLGRPLSVAARAKLAVVGLFLTGASLGMSLLGDNIASRFSLAFVTDLALHYMANTFLLKGPGKREPLPSQPKAPLSLEEQARKYVFVMAAALERPGDGVRYGRFLWGPRQQGNAMAEFALDEGQADAYLQRQLRDPENFEKLQADVVEKVRRQMRLRDDFVDRLEEASDWLTSREGFEFLYSLVGRPVPVLSDEDRGLLERYKELIELAGEEREMTRLLKADPSQVVELGQVVRRILQRSEENEGVRFYTNEATLRRRLEGIEAVLSNRNGMGKAALGGRTEFEQNVAWPFREEIARAVLALPGLALGAAWWYTAVGAIHAAAHLHKLRKGGAADVLHQALSLTLLPAALALFSHVFVGSSLARFNVSDAASWATLGSSLLAMIPVHIFANAVIQPLVNAALSRVNAAFRLSLPLLGPASIGVGGEWGRMLRGVVDADKERKIALYKALGIWDQASFALMKDRPAAELQNWSPDPEEQFVKAEALAREAGTGDTDEEREKLLRHVNEKLLYFGARGWVMRMHWVKGQKNAAQSPSDKVARGVREALAWADRMWTEGPQAVAAPAASVPAPLAPASIPAPISPLATAPTVAAMPASPYLLGRDRLKAAWEEFRRIAGRGMTADEFFAARDEAGLKGLPAAQVFQRRAEKARGLPAPVVPSILEAPPEMLLKQMYAALLTSASLELAREFKTYPYYSPDALLLDLSPDLAKSVMEWINRSDEEKRELKAYVKDGRIAPPRGGAFRDLWVVNETWRPNTPPMKQVWKELPLSLAAALAWARDKDGTAAGGGFGAGQILAGLSAVFIGTTFSFVAKAQPKASLPELGVNPEAWIYAGSVGLFFLLTWGLWFVTKRAWVREERDEEALSAARTLVRLHLFLTPQPRDDKRVEKAVRDFLTNPKSRDAILGGLSGLAALSDEKKKELLKTLDSREMLQAMSYLDRVSRGHVKFLAGVLAQLSNYESLDLKEGSLLILMDEVVQETPLIVVRRGMLQSRPVLVSMAKEGLSPAEREKSDGFLEAEARNLELLQAHVEEHPEAERFFSRLEPIYDAERGVLVKGVPEGQSLAALLAGQRSGRLSPADALQVASRVLEALENLPAGMVHEGLALESVYYDVKMRHAQLDGFASMTPAGREPARLGSSPFASPGTEKGPRSSSRQDDLYSVGALIYRMVTGDEASLLTKVPGWKRMTSQEAGERVSQAASAELEKRRFPAETGEILMKILSGAFRTEGEGSFASVDAMRKAVEQGALDLGFGTLSLHDRVSRSGGVGAVEFEQRGDKLVAIKRAKPSQNEFETAGRKKIILREIKAMTLLQEKYQGTRKSRLFPRLLSADFDVPQFTMEVYDKDLRDYLALYPKKRLPIGQALFILREAAEATAAMHAAGLIHQDIKPANIFVNEGADKPSQVSLADFSVNVGVGEDAAVGGEPPYKAPEEFDVEDNDMRDSMVHEPSADVYSLGVVLYQMLTGYPWPFPKRYKGVGSLSRIMIANNAWHARLDSIDAMDLPDPMKNLLKRLLAIDIGPEGRFETAQEAFEAIGAVDRLLPADAKNKPMVLPAAFFPGADSKLSLGLSYRIGRFFGLSDRTVETEIAPRLEVVFLLPIGLAEALAATLSAVGWRSGQAAAQAFSGALKGWFVLAHGKDQSVGQLQARRRGVETISEDTLEGLKTGLIFGFLFAGAGLLVGTLGMGWPLKSAAEAAAAVLFGSIFIAGAVVNAVSHRRHNVENPSAPLSLPAEEAAPETLPSVPSIDHLSPKARALVGLLWSGPARPVRFDLATGLTREDVSALVRRGDKGSLVGALKAAFLDPSVVGDAEVFKDALWDAVAALKMGFKDGGLLFVDVEGFEGWTEGEKAALIAVLSAAARHADGDKDFRIVLADRDAKGAGADAVMAAVPALRTLKHDGVLFSQRGSRVALSPDGKRIHVLDTVKNLELEAWKDSLQPVAREAESLDLGGLKENIVPLVLRELSKSIGDELRRLILLAIQA